MRLIDRFLPAKLPAEDETAARVLVGVALGFAVATPLGLVLRWLVGEVYPVAAAITVICCLAFAAVPWLLRTSGSLRTAGLVLNASLFVLIFGNGWYAGGLGGPVLTIAPLLPLVATFLLGSRAGVLVTVVLVASLTAMLALSYAGIELPQPRFAGHQELVARSLFLGIAIVLTTLFAGLYRRQRTAVERQLRQSRDLYRKLFEQSKDIVALTTGDGRLVDLNPAGVELLGFTSKQELLGQDVTHLYADPEQRRALLARLEADGFVRDYESQLRTRCGAIRLVHGTTSTIRGETGTIEYLLAILQDVTEQRRDEAEREALLAELTAKNEDLRQFTHAVSHDLKSPLTTVRGFIGLLLRDVRDGRLERLERSAEAVDSGAEKMGRIIDGLLELAQIGRGRLSRREVALDRVAGDAVELLAERIAAAGATVEVGADLPSVEGDPALLLTVLVNLIDNGVKYSSGRRDPEIRVGWRRDDGEVVFTVADNGAGIALDYQQQIFDLFRQLNADDEGTGIGLASVRRAVEAHGGRVWVESAGEGRGSTFCFTVPARCESEIIDLGDRRDLLAGR